MFRLFRCFTKLIVIVLLVIGFGIFLLCQWFVKEAGAHGIYTSVESIPAREVGLVLGSSAKLPDGRDNLYFKGRIEAAAELYKAGKVKHLLVSGDNRTAGYNEPEDMRKALIAKGVPDSAITLDYAGLRTLDSIVRAKKIFGADKFTIISQTDHDARALLIARHYDIDAIAFAAPDVQFKSAIGSHVREWLARVKVILDLYILRTAPKHLGQREQIK
ncbi:MAG TPA: ElyC/SanA/YdcF family protein [Chthoniobacteraceae bacterium]|nr:ElyC/SanA/YdcF family protein [Chthoniobacteraceae bacterium]